MATDGFATPARSFALRLTAWSLALFGLFRIPWIGVHLLLPATQLQAAAGAALLGPSSLPIEATLACSGADALALCVAAIVAYPARWRMRGAGVAAGIAVLLTLNTIRIGTLGRAAASPWFNTLHVYVWPAVLTIAIAGLVFTWMRLAGQPTPRSDSRSAKASAERQDAAGPEARLKASPHELKASPHEIVSWRFALVAAACLLLFTLASPLYLESAGVLAIAQLVARAAAALLRAAGLDAQATAGLLATPRGAFIVTQECVSTPLIPVYAAAVIVYARTWRRALLWAALGAPLFFALGIARLLVVAVPASMASSPAFLIHAFSQLLVGAGMVCAAAVWRHGARPAAYGRAVVALLAAFAFVQLLGAPYTRAILWFNGVPLEDPQGALLFLPAFQAGLFLALWIAAFARSGWTRFVGGASLLAVVQIAVSGGVQLLFVYGGVAPMVRDVRAWALLGPALVIATVINLASARR